MRVRTARLRQKILWFIRDYRDLHEMMPMAKEIEEHIGLSNSATRGHIDALIASGHLRRGTSPRSYTLVKVDF